MTLERPSRYTGSAALLVLLCLVGAVGLASASPDSGKPAPAQATPGPPEPPLRPDPEAVGAARCSLVLTRFTSDPTGEHRLRSSVQNTGPTTVTLHAIQLGWDGSAALSTVHVRRAGGNVAQVYGDVTTSPALVALDGPNKPRLQLGPDASLELVLTFDARDEVDMSAALGPVVVFTEEGCAAAVSRHREQLKGCELTAGPISLPENQRNRIQFELENAGQRPALLAALELYWPAETNGRLLAVIGRDETIVRYPVGEGPKSSPAVIDFSRLGLNAVAIAGDSRVRVRLEFEKPVAKQHYAVRLVTVDGCAATTSTWVDQVNSECGVTAAGFDVRGEIALLRLSNSRPVTGTLTSLDVFWPVATAGHLTSIRVDGEAVWSRPVTRSPAQLDLPGVPLAPHSTSELQLSFKPAAQGSETPIQSIAGGEFTIVAGLGGGCNAVFSTLQGGPASCSVSAAEMSFEPDEAKATVELTNAGADANLRLLAVTWPARNGDLVGVWLGNDALFDGGAKAPPRPKPYTIPLSGKEAVIPRNESRVLAMAFADRVSRRGYALSMSFDDPAGLECSELMVTSPDAKPDCRLELGNLSTPDERFVELDVQNLGRDELEVRFVDAEWPNPDRTNGLSQVSLVDAESGEQVIVWQSGREEPAKTHPPVRVFPNGAEPPLIEAGAHLKLRLRFTGLLDRERLDPADFRVTMGTVEGCEASFAPSGSRLPTARESFSGVVRKLPDDPSDLAGLFGTWLIESQGQLRSVEVDRGTRFVPVSVTPRAGDRVRVDALRGDGGALRAVEITFRGVTPGTEIVGVVEQVYPASGRPVWIDVSGIRVWIVEATLIEGALESGSQVSVEGKHNADRTVIASRIVVTEPPRGRPIRITGVLQARPQSAAQFQTWAVDKYRVLVPLDKVPRQYLQDAQPGGRVEIQGRLMTRNLIQAERVKVLDRKKARRVEGTLAELPPAGLLGKWTIRTPSGETSFVVESLAAVDTSVAPAGVGMHVRAVVRSGHGEPVALRVRMDW